ncbi:MAG: tripartite tricarboxylate transporter substrate binding protein [Betaproteobacteria bacterium]|nr:tripartite tricarboxylate transporter substrate binding protein [Betaproteobacteria bacterium]
MTTIRSMLLALMITPLVALGQAYPSKPVRVVVPFAAGGLVDTISRAIGSRLGEVIGQSVVIDNRGGGGGTIGADIVAKAAPDGYTLVLSGGPPHGVYSLFIKNVPFDTIRDFTPIVIFGTAPQVLVVHPSFPATSVRELVGYAKANPGKLSYGSSGIGSPHHLGGLLLNRTAGIDMVHIAYKGGGPALSDVIGGQVPVAMLAMSTIVPHVKSGKLRLLAVLEAQRSKAMPDTPTIAESGFPGYAVPDTWIGFLGPANLPAAIVAQLNAAVLKAVAYPDARSRLETAGFEIKGNTPQEFAEVVAKSQDIYSKIMTEAGIKPE